MREDNGTGFIAKPGKIGIPHSYTVQETETVSSLNVYILKCGIRGIELTNYTKPDWHYCIVENGEVFKFHPNEHVFYQLDLDKHVWYRNQSFAALIYDTYLRFQEISGFVDYYPHADE